MTPDERNLRGCLGKKSYSTFGLALVVARRCQKERGDKLRIYHCVAGHFHLTKVANDKTQRAASRCGICLEPFEPATQDEWTCATCAAVPT